MMSLKTVLGAKLLFASLFLSMTGVSYGHAGGQDANGGHTNRATGEYHCHKPSCVLPTVEDAERDCVDAAAADVSTENVSTENLSTENLSTENLVLASINEVVLDDITPEPVEVIAGSWASAKKWAKHEIYKGRNKSFYCGCSYSETVNRDGISLASCDYNMSGAKNQARADDLEWEHVVPASLMSARQFSCWNGEGLAQCKKGSRHCCERYDLKARAMIFDLHNMVPSVGQVNALRSNKRYGIIAGEERNLACDFEWQGDIAEPPEQRLGDVARIWLYMHKQHDLELQEGELEMYLAWSRQDPPTAWEFERNARIKAKQGNGNPFVEIYQGLDVETIITVR